MALNAPELLIKDSWEGTGALGVIVDELNRISNIISNITGDGIEIDPGFNGIHFNVPRSNLWPMLSFWYTQSGADVTIRAGNLRIHGSKNIAVAETNLTLTGSPEWIYVKHVRTSDTATIEHSVSEPETTPTTLNYPLYKFTFDTTIQAYRLADHGIKHVGDINLDTPLGA